MLPWLQPGSMHEIRQDQHPGCEPNQLFQDWNFAYQQSHQGATSSQPSPHLSSLSTRRSPIASGCPELKALYHASLDTQALNSLSSVGQLGPCTGRSQRLSLQGYGGLFDGPVIDGSRYKSARGDKSASGRKSAGGGRGGMLYRRSRKCSPRKGQTNRSQIPWRLVDTDRM